MVVECYAVTTLALGSTIEARTSLALRALSLTITVCVRAHPLRVLAVQTGLADGRVLVRTRAAVLGLVVLGAGGETRVEDGALDVVVRVGIHAVSGLGGRGDLQVPRAPPRHVRRGHALFEREGEGRIGAELGVIHVSDSAEEAAGGDANGVGEVGRDFGRGFAAPECDEAEGEVVAVYEGDVVKGLSALGGQSEFCKGDGYYALYYSLERAHVS